MTERKSEGRFEVAVYIDGDRIRRIAKTREEAEEIRATLLRQRDAAQLIGSEEQTVAVFLDGWLEHTARRRLRAHSLWCYESRLRRIVGMIGHHRLCDLKPAHIRVCYSRLLDEGLSAATLEAYHVVLHSALEQAVDDEIIPRNPTAKIDRPKVERHEQKCLSDEEIKRVLDVSRGEPWYPLWALLLTTGLRIGEALALTWDRVDLNRGVIEVRETLTRGKEGLTTGPVKTPKANRNVQLSHVALEPLRAHSKDQIATGKRPERNLVFPSRQGGLQCEQTIGRTWKRTLAAAGLDPIRVHDMRHTAASFQNRHGTDIRTLQEILGHSSAAITMNRYIHVSQEMHQAAADLVDRMLGTGG